jgi:cytochrome b pre-mRNA-processing protein 3
MAAMGSTTGSMFRLPFSRRFERDAAARIYAAALAAARRPALYLDYGVPDTLQGRFEMVALHLFAVLHRLMHEPGDGRDLARMVSERFVDDMDGAFREMGVGDLSVPKRMQKLYSSFAGRITAYERGIVDEGGALADAISRNIFPDGGEARHAAALADYLRAAVRAIRSAELADIRAGTLAYPPLPQEEGRAGDA